jgi:hypothetical protein
VFRGGSFAVGAGIAAAAFRHRSPGKASTSGSGVCDRLPRRADRPRARCAMRAFRPAGLGGVGAGNAAKTSVLLFCYTKTNCVCASVEVARAPELLPVRAPRDLSRKRSRARKCCSDCTPSRAGPPTLPCRSPWPRYPVTRVRSRAQHRRRSCASRDG